MADRSAPTTPPSAEQLGWLSVAPPTDEQDQPIRWSLDGCRIAEVNWTRPITHNFLTLDHVDMVAVQWQGPVFRNCIVRDVEFERCNFAHARFERVSFENCTFTRTTFENSAFDHCRFVDCKVRYHTAVRTALRLCEFERLELDVLDMRECDLSGTSFEASRLSCPRLSKTRADSLEITGGELRGADLTACELGKLALEGGAIAGLRLLDCELGRVAIVDAKVEGLAICGGSVDWLLLRRCAELPGARMLETKIAELTIDACAAVPSLLIADSSVTTLGVRASALFDAAFERVEVGRGWFEAGELTGVLFDGGEWTLLELTGVAVNDYVAVKQTRFGALRFEQPVVDPQLDLRLAGDGYGPGSPTWSQIKGAAHGP